MIELKHLSKRYGDFMAVEDLNLTIESGKIYGLLGKNGAGKSTTMNMITGYIAATEGEITICDQDLLKEPEKAKANIGYLPEVPPLYADMSVYEYLKFCAELKGVEKSKRDEVIYEIMDRTKITDMENRLIRNLSKGYRQRVGLAQALIGYPDIIILDEPSAGLDPVQMKEMRDLIKELGQNHTIILSSHILSEISAVCDYVYIISRGKLVYSESMEKLEAGDESLEDIFVRLTSEEEEKEC